MVRKLWWMVQKDLLSECRSRRVWPAMLAFGMVVAFVFSAQVHPIDNRGRPIFGSLLWLATLLAGMVSVDRSFALEREQGCWEGLRLYPVSPAAVFAAKWVVNVVALGALQLVLIPLFVVLCEVPLLVHPWAMGLVAVLGNLGLATIGTLVSALTAGIRHGGGLLALLVLPMAVPVVLASAEATHLVAQGNLGAEWWRWIQLLGVFVIVFLAAGVFLFDFLVED